MPSNKVFPLVLSLLLALCSLVSADYTISAPAAGSTFAASSAIKISFEDDGNAPAFTELSTTKVLLCTGPNSDIYCFTTAVGTFTPTASLTSYSASVAALAALGSNGRYYFQFYSTVTAGGNSIHYSPRFTLTGMTGSYKASDGGDTTPPDGSTTVGSSDSVAGYSEIMSKNKVTYTLQTGKTRYAPMQMQPGSKVTIAKSATRRFPVSSVSYFTDYSLQPYQVTTMTPSWSYTILQGPNYASTAASPTGYYAASEALARNINAKSRRGYFEL